MSLIGGLLSTIFFLVIGVKAATGEYAAGMIRLTLTATPRRDRVLAAKAIVVSVLMTACGLVLAVAMFLVAQAIFASYGMPAASLGDGDALRAVLGTAVLSAQFPLIAMALGFVLRSTAGAVIGVFATLFAPAFLGGLLPAWFNEHVAIYTPGAASDAISIGHLEGARGRPVAGRGRARRRRVDDRLPRRSPGWRSSAATHNPRTRRTGKPDTPLSGASCTVKLHIDRLAISVFDADGCRSKRQISEIPVQPWSAGLTVFW